MKLGDFLTNERQKLGLTQKQLAEKLDTSVTYISSVENGMSKLSPEKITSYCIALNFDKFKLSMVWDFVLKEELERINNRYADFKQYLGL